jgi:PTS system nitrogen regulatory IIA component
MKSLLRALQEGRLVELPDNTKEKALEYLAHLIEAIPEVPSTDLSKEALDREKSGNTGIGLGVACPHVRSQNDGDLLCAVGWSPVGIDYGSKDGGKVHLVVMYYIPDSQKTTYLREVSMLAGAIKREGGIQEIAKAADISTVREELLDWVSAATEAGIPETKARMIRLEARQAALAQAEIPAAPGAPAIQVIPVLILTLAPDKFVVLCENREMAAELEKDVQLGVLLKQRTPFERFGYKFLHRAITVYDPSRPLYEYIAVKVG